MSALNYVLAEDIYSTINVPPHDNSAVDGYALAHQAELNGQRFEISQRIPAGSSPAPLEAGTVARIFTGAPMPEGADCVIMQEDVELNAEQDITLKQAPRPGANIRPAGQDVAKGSLVLAKGTSLSPQRLGLIASIGQASVKVYEPLKVAIFSTGDELVEPGNPCGPGQIYNSNRYTLSTLLSNFGMEVFDLGVIPDTLCATQQAFQDAAANADVIVSTGGASVGEEDYIQQALRELGELELWRVAIKPGKPFMFGKVGDCPVLGLPGNPAAVLVTALNFVRPFLLKSQGFSNYHANSYELPCDFDITQAGKRREFIRVQVSSEGTLKPHPNQSSGMLSSASWADGLAVIPEHRCIEQGQRVTYMPFAELLNVPV